MVFDCTASKMADSKRRLSPMEDSIAKMLICKVRYWFRLGACVARPLSSCNLHSESFVLSRTASTEGGRRLLRGGATCLYTPLLWGQVVCAVLDGLCVFADSLGELRNSVSVFASGGGVYASWGLGALALLRGDGL